MADPDAAPCVFPDVTGRKVLFLGLGGGCDIITAYALARIVGGDTANIVYGNTKTGDVGRVDALTENIFRVSGPLVDASRCEELIEPVVVTQRTHAVPFGELVQLVIAARHQCRQLDLVELRDRREHRRLREVPHPDHRHSQSR